MVDLIEIGIEEIAENQLPFLAEYFPNFFAEGLIPVNPRHWPAFVAGSAMASDMPEFGDKLKTPLENLRVAKEFLESSKSEIQWRDRFWKVAEDCIGINAACELGEDAGSFGAGCAANKIADKYMNEMVNTELTLDPYEQLNMKCYKRQAVFNGQDPTLVRGTGLFQQFVPNGSIGKSLKAAKPLPGARPIWRQKAFKGNKNFNSTGFNSTSTGFNGTGFGFITPFVFNKRGVLMLAKSLLSPRPFSIIRDIIYLYSYYRYIKLAVKVFRKIKKPISSRMICFKTKILNKIKAMRKSRRKI